MRPSRSWSQVASCLGILAIIAAVPLVWRAALAVSGAETLATPSYLPALEASRVRGPFVDTPIRELDEIQPGIVIIGDSMGGRIHEDHLAGIAGMSVVPMLTNATGPAHWYLVFKNYVVASKIRPKWVVIFFRDTNLTDVMFRLDGPYRLKLDEVARAFEPELNAAVARRTGGVWAGVHQSLEATYRAKTARAWVEPALNTWPARVLVGASRQPFLIDRVNAAFTLDKLRSTAQADLAAADARDADFGRYVDASALPLFLSAARDANLRLCFVRVMRRPVGGTAPPDSPPLHRYLEDLRTYVEANGAAFLNDHDDPELATLPYADGDHISRDARVPYTDQFWPKLQRLVR